MISKCLHYRTSYVNALTFGIVELRRVDGQRQQRQLIVGRVVVGMLELEQQLIAAAQIDVDEIGSIAALAFRRPDAGRNVVQHDSGFSV